MKKVNYTWCLITIIIIIITINTTNLVIDRIQNMLLKLAYHALNLFIPIIIQIHLFLNSAQKRMAIPFFLHYFSNKSLYFSFFHISLISFYSHYSLITNLLKN